MRANTDAAERPRTEPRGPVVAFSSRARRRFSCSRSQIFLVRVERTFAFSHCAGSQTHIFRDLERSPQSLAELLTRGGEGVATEAAAAADVTSGYPQSRTLCNRHRLVTKPWRRRRVAARATPSSSRRAAAVVHALAALVYGSSAFRSRLSLPVRRFCCAFPEGGAARLAIAAGAAAVLGARYRTCDAQTQRINGIRQRGSAHGSGELRALPTELFAAPPSRGLAC